jgi:hypothetical protein
VNLSQYSIAFLISALPTLALADASISLNKGDFIAAEKLSSNGETVVRLKLSKSGKAKFKKLNQHAVNSATDQPDVHSEIAGVKADFKLREPIKGDDLQMGPYSNAAAEKVVSEIKSK